MGLFERDEKGEKEGESMRREFPYYCLGCEKVIYLARYDIGKTACPRCGSTRILPVAVAFPVGIKPGRKISREKTKTEVKGWKSL